VVRLRVVGLREAQSDHANRDARADDGRPNHRRAAAKRPGRGAIARARNHHPAAVRRVKPQNNRPFEGGPMQIVLATSPHVRPPAVLQMDFAPDPSAMYTFAPVGLLALTAMLRRNLEIEPVLFDTNQHIINGAIPLDASFYHSAADRICALNPDV